MPNIDHVGVNDKGRRVGEDNPNATLTDHEVDLLLEMRDSTNPPMGYRKLARAFDISKSQARNIVKGDQRAQRAVRFKPRCTRP